ncbi:MAG: hypothetical protein V7K50_24050 [Nostoc sp.]|uniref:hypothetical protein n=1 Tax=Nostoc sp. TaxID=1180 RepID=UPI002FF732F5
MTLLIEYNFILLWCLYQKIYAISIERSQTVITLPNHNNLLRILYRLQISLCLVQPQHQPRPQKMLLIPNRLKRRAVQVIGDYYSAIAHLDYKQAYSVWERNGAASKQSFEQFKQGLANTTSVAV